MEKLTDISVFNGVYTQDVLRIAANLSIWQRGYDEIDLVGQLGSILASQMIVLRDTQDVHSTKFTRFIYDECSDIIDVADKIEKFEYKSAALNDMFHNVSLTIQK